MYNVTNTIHMHEFFMCYIVDFLVHISNFLHKYVYVYVLSNFKNGLHHIYVCATC